jgi:hypothetical protein
VTGPKTVIREHVPLKSEGEAASLRQFGLGECWRLTEAGAGAPWYLRSRWWDARGMLWYAMLWSLVRLRLRSAQRVRKRSKTAPRKQQTGEG